MWWAAGVLRAPRDQVADRVAALAKEVRDLKKKLTAGAPVSGVTVESLVAGATDLAGVKVVVAEVPGAAAGALRGLVDALRRQGGPTAALLASREDGKVLLLAGVTDDLVKKGIDAGAWVGVAAEAVGGRGGGRKDFAQAGGREPEKLPAALEKAKAHIAAKLGGS